MTALTNSEIEAALERFTRNQLAIKALEEEQEALKGFFKDQATAFPAGTYNTFGKFYIKVSGHSRIDQKLAEKNLTPSRLRLVTKSVIDPRLAKARLNDAELEKITKVYDNRIEIGLV